MFFLETFLGGRISEVQKRVGGSFWWGSLFLIGKPLNNAVDLSPCYVISTSPRNQVGAHKFAAASISLFFWLLAAKEDGCRYRC